MRVLVAHVGWDAGAPTAVVVSGLQPGSLPACTLVSADGVRTDLVATPAETVDAWQGGAYSRVELGRVEAGTYRVEATADGMTASSAPFTVAEDRIPGSTLSDVLYAFKAVRSSGEIDAKDADASLIDRPGGPTVDARGGWLDASGDPSKFLSHLTYSPTMSPQQIPICVWAMFEARDRLRARHPRFDRVVGARLRDEGLFGADFLVRFRSPEGWFYSGIFDGLTKRLEERVINAPLPECVRTDRYQASYRGGGGVAIAALARAARVAETEPLGAFGAAEYLDAATRAFDDLERHNADYLFGLDLASGDLTPSTESMVDDVCALLAAAELAGVDPRPAVIEAAERRVRALLARYRRDAAPGAPGWFEAWDDGRPYFSPVEAGLPVVALLRFADVLPSSTLAADARALAVRTMADLVARTDAVANPFGYPRQRVQPLGGAARDAFFFPHDNDTGYWWQGENATLASLAFAARLVADLSETDDALRARLHRFADDQVAWILGRNPFDVCMLQGRGRNNAEYSVDYPNVPGGIVNGITSAFDDEHGIAFLDPDRPGDSWRWSEQWIPHSAWFLLAVATR
ncbi:glycoside hydrolase family 9 protein [Microbacterium sp. NPDC058389]|uniref:glycoside hydrolase family 9 protein n=1 Tax=Microbacterium sp. NPDC058389 TaxID=3346475 RepID=UPI00365C7DF9